MPISVLIVGEDPRMRNALRTRLRLVADLAIVGESASAEAQARTSELKPDVVFLHVRAHASKRLGIAGAIRRTLPGVNVILVVDDGSRASATKAIQLGMAGYVLDDSPGDVLAQAARFAVEGKTLIDPQLTGDFVETPRTNARRGNPSALSHREKAILHKMVAGATTSEIAADLGVSPRTVRRYVERMFEKLLGPSDPRGPTLPPAVAAALPIPIADPRDLPERRGNDRHRCPRDVRTGRRPDAARGQPARGAGAHAAGRADHRGAVARGVRGGPPPGCPSHRASKDRSGGEAAPGSR
jgi:DNA-binding NarL/FixJ family response regulator